MKLNFKCPFCGLQLEPDSIFCRGCGHKIEDKSTVIDPDGQELIQISANFLKEPEKALNACIEYIKHFPDNPIARDMKITSSIIGTIGTLIILVNGQFPKIRDQQDYELNAKAVTLAAEGLPEILKNGVITIGRISDKVKRIKTIKFIQSTQEIIAKHLISLFEEARQEKESLLIDGKTRAVIEKKTMEDFHDDAEVYYRVYQEGDLNGALRGFVHLKTLNPMDAYLRNMTGTLLSLQGKTRDALKEFLFGLHLDPGEPNLTSNVMRELSALALHSIALEIWSHYCRYRQPDRNPESDKKVELFANFSKIITTTLACASAGITQDDLSPNVEDILDEIIFPERPWLTEYQNSGKHEKILLDKTRVFISYRRVDSADLAQRLQQKMKTSYPAMYVFLDEAAMIGGEDFTEQIRTEIDRADVFLLLIGPYWDNPEGQKRLNETTDILRREIARALNKEVPIIPLLIQGTKMPSDNYFPEELRPVTKLHAEKLRVDKLDMDWGKLQKSMIRVIEERKLEQKAIEDMSLDDWQNLIDAGKVNLPKFVPAKSKSGEGVPDGQINLYGIWKCIAVGPNQRFSIKLIIEDRPGNLFKGELQDEDINGRIIRSHKMRGEWMQVLDVDVKPTILLGLHLKFVLDETTPYEITIPFQQKAGDVLVGKDQQGMQYTSRNIESWSGGF